MKWCSESSWKYKSLGTQPSGKSKFKYKLISPRILKDEVKWSEVAQLCPALCDPMGCSLSGSSVHGIFQARVQEWTAISFSRGSSQPRNQIQVCCIAGRRFTVWATREVFTNNVFVKTLQIKFLLRKKNHATEHRGYITLEVQVFPRKNGFLNLKGCVPFLLTYSKPRK